MSSRSSEWMGADLAGVTCLASVTPTDVEWIWEGKFPRGKIVVVDGDPDLGKSTVMLDLAARITSGGVMPDGAAVKPASVLLLSAEDDAADTIVPRLIAAAADLGRIFQLTHTLDLSSGQSRGWEFPTDAEELHTEAVGLNTALVIIDPLEAFLADGVNVNNNHQVRRALAPLARVAQATGACIVAVRHLTKDRANPRAIYRGQGSIGIIGAARAGLVIAPDPDDDDRRILAVTKCNLAAPERKKALAFRIAVDRIQLPNGSERTVPTIAWEGEVEVEADELFAPPNTESQQAAEDFLRAKLALAKTPDNAIPKREIVAEAVREGISVGTLDRMKKRLGIRHTKPGRLGGDWRWYWPRG